MRALIAQAFLPVVSLLYAVLAGLTAFVLWQRLQRIRTLFYQEFAALEMVEARLGEKQVAENLMLSEHLSAIHKYALESGTGAPARWNRLPQLGASAALRGDAPAQAQLLAASQARAERRSTMAVSFPLVLWASLRVLAMAILGAFCALTAGERSRAFPAIFAVLVLILYWSNHLCRDLSDCCRGDFSVESQEVERQSGLAALTSRLRRKRTTSKSPLD